MWSTISIQKIFWIVSLFIFALTQWKSIPLLSCSSVCMEKVMLASVGVHFSTSLRVFYLVNSCFFCLWIGTTLKLILGFKKIYDFIQNYFVLKHACTFFVPGSHSIFEKFWNQGAQGLPPKSDWILGPASCWENIK